MSGMDATRDVYEIWAAQCVNRSCVASFAFLVWDAITSFDEEVEFIWRKPMTWTRALFLFIRYFAISVQVALLFVGTEIAEVRTAASCYGWFIFQALAMQVLVTSVEIVLMLRVQALYAHNKLVKYGVVVLLAVEFVVMATCEYYTVAGLEFDSTCIVTKSTYAILGYGAAAILYELFLFSLTLIKFVHALRTGWSDTPVLQLLVRDGTWAFALIFFTMLANAICYGAISGGLSAVAFTWLMSVLAFAGCRLMLNMHALAAPAAQTPYTTREREADRTLHDTHLDFGAVGARRSRCADLESASADCTSASTWGTGVSSGFGDSVDAGTFVLGGRRAKDGKAAVEFELANMGGSKEKGKGKGKMADHQRSPHAHARAYRRSPLSTISIDFASFTSSTVSSSFCDRERGSSSRGTVAAPPPEDLFVRVPERHHSRPESGGGDSGPTSPTTPLSADPLMRDWHSTTLPSASPG